jgi:hypothetical protein
MVDPRSEISSALDDLIARGLRLEIGLIADAPNDVRAAVAQQLETQETAPKGAAKTAKRGSRQSAGEDLRDVFELRFEEGYQAWYSLALPVVQQILPDRYAEFRELHRLDKRPRELDPATYSISDYLQGIRVTQGYMSEDAFSGWHVAYTKFKLQLNIVRSVADRLGSVLADIVGLVESALFDDEILAARELIKSGYLRSAGIVASVVLERHLKRLLMNHTVTLRKKPQIGSMNDALKGAGVYGVPEWRRIQHLGDLRNLCGHDGDNEPTRQDVDELISGVQTITSSVF